MASPSYVKVTKDLSLVKNKLAFGLTRRQLIAVAAGAAVGFPVFFALRPHLPTDFVSIIMVFVVSPCFFIGFFEKDNRPIEVYIMLFLRFKLRPQTLVYKTCNIYAALNAQTKILKEYARYVQQNTKPKKRRQAPAH